MKIAVVGGGVAGLGTAWRLGQAGATVTLFDGGVIPARGGAATWASGGMICARLEMRDAPAPLKAFALNARAAWPGFAGELARKAQTETGYVERGALHAVFVGEPFPEPGEGVELIDANAARALEPGLAPDLRGASWAQGEAHVDPRWLALALVRACRAAGVTFAPGTRVLRLAPHGDGVGGVVTDKGLLRFDHVVLAAGAWTSELLAASDLPGPRLRPVKGQMLSLAGGAAPPVSRLVWAPGCYIIPHADGHILIGATQEETGFDTGLDHAAIDRLKDHAVRAVPALAELPEIERFAGLRPASDDGLPLLGGVGVEHLTLASGQFRNGILLAPLIADAAAQHALENRLPPVARPFTAARFTVAAA
ncbi:MAG: glycine oxidase ThiO [Alphaproteobacteria bacterium]|nr:glycine oxidase ThiO [Alphaproteobacteria bacterium]